MRGSRRSALPTRISFSTTEPYFVDLEKEGVDIAVRLARPTRGSVGMRKIANVPFGRFAATQYVNRQRTLGGEAMNVISLASDFCHRGHEFKFVDERRGDHSNLCGQVAHKWVKSF